MTAITDGVIKGFLGSLLPVLAMWGSSALALTWESLGPFGGAANTLAANPLRGVVYVKPESGPIHYSENNGATWTPTAPFPGCSSQNAWPGVAGFDGSLYVICGSVFRSRDDGRTWSVYFSFPGPYAGPNALPVFDPTRPGRAVLRSTDTAYATEDDGVTWRALPQDSLAPRYYAFDPRRSGRLVAALTQSHVGGGADVITSIVLQESFDFGATWRTAGTIVPAQLRSLFCFSREIVFAPTGTLFVSSTCGAFRSLDGGTTWSEIGAAQGFKPAGFAPDFKQSGRVVAWSNEDIIESLDDGRSWRVLPRPPASRHHEERAHTITITPNRQVFIATIDGVYAFDEEKQVWERRVLGIQGVRMPAPEIAPQQASRLMAATLDERSLVSDDGGLTWSQRSIGDKPVRSIHKNLTDASSFYAYTIDGLHRSADGGKTWTYVAPPPDYSRYETILSDLLPVGPQPGLVYALSGECRSSFTGCFPTPRDVVRSMDGGVTWKSVFKTGYGTGPVPPPIAEGPVASQLMASPSDANRLLMVTTTDVYRTSDRGVSWETASPLPAGGARIVADPTNASHWYALYQNGPILESADFGTSWSPISTPATERFFIDLLIDPRAPNRFYLVGADGAVSMSEDRGIHWQTLVGSSQAYFRGVRLAPLAGNALYAGTDEGVKKLVLRPPAVTPALALIEYYRADVDHYFMTANPAEIAKLDAAGGPFARTGQSFNAWSAAAPDDDAASVCRFYGKPEAQLDSHFFTASTAECDQVIARFSQSWILEATRNFAMLLPNPFGECRAGTLPVYRLFNDRRDVNHRYTTSLAVRDEMRRLGWIAEGYGPDAVAMCGLNDE